MKFLSYPLTRDTPLYPGTPKTKCNSVKQIQQGDSANTCVLSISTHASTHIDMPRHFCDKARMYESWPQQFSCFFISVPRRGDLPILYEDLIGQPIPKEVDALFVVTGSWQDRGDRSYCDAHPWLHPDTCVTLRENFPMIRLIGFDLISISSPLHREEGRAAHRCLLCEKPEIFILEDLDLSDSNLIGMKKDVWVIPWFIDEEMDGSPALVITSNSA